MKGDQLLICQRDSSRYRVRGSGEGPEGVVRPSRVFSCRGVGVLVIHTCSLQSLVQLYLCHRIAQHDPLYMWCHAKQFVHLVRLAQLLSQPWVSDGSSARTQRTHDRMESVRSTHWLLVDCFTA